MLERLEFTLSKGPYPLPVAVSIKHGLHFHLWYDPGEQVALCPTHMLLDRARPIHVESMKLLGWPVSVRCPWQCRPCGKRNTEACVWVILNASLFTDLSSFSPGTSTTPTMSLRSNSSCRRKEAVAHRYSLKVGKAWNNLWWQVQKWLPVYSKVYIMSNLSLQRWSCLRSVEAPTRALVTTSPACSKQKTLASSIGGYF